MSVPASSIPRGPSETSISEAEQRVLEWMYYGKSNEEIAELLHVSAFTVKNQVQSLMRKLGVESRTRLVTSALEKGLLRLKGHDYIRFAQALRKKGRQA